LAVWGNGDTQPPTSNINYTAPGQTTNAAIVKLNDNKVKVWVNDSATDVIIDVAGYYTNVPSTATTNYTYAPDGLRKTKTSTVANPVTFNWDRASGLPMLLSETTNSTLTTYYIYGPGGLPVEQINPDGSTLYLHHDQLGSTRLITNTTGDTIATYTYEPYGRLTARTGTADTPSATPANTPTPKPATNTSATATTTPPPHNSSPAIHSPQPRAVRTATYGSPLNATDPTGMAPGIGWGQRGHFNRNRHSRTPRHGAKHSR
jgi:hypothetical protein